MKKLNKKGFSLVELIIVIAIMAILVGIVASQVVPYLEKSRRGKDLQQLEAVNTALVASISSSPKSVPSFPSNLNEGLKLCAPDDGDPDGASSGLSGDDAYPEGCEISRNLFGLMEPIDGMQVYNYEFFLDKCIRFQDHMKSKAYCGVWAGDPYESDPENNRGVNDCYIRVSHDSSKGLSTTFMVGRRDLCAESF
ncbi:MAG: type II secretion system GspH family protein [Lachnospiraceae bacterium]|nr:type II secretion system GspH family protein [Lachnospiraceae bacterium]